MEPKLEYLKHTTSCEVSKLMAETVWYRRQIIRSEIKNTDGLAKIGEKMPCLFDIVGMVKYSKHMR